MATPRPFQYHALLRIRKRQEDVKARLLAATRRDISITEAKRDEIVRQQLMALEQAGHTAQERFDAEDVRRYYQHERHLAWLAVDADAMIKQLAAKAEGQRQELEAAMKKRRMIERLKERRDAMYRAELLKTEQKQLDETATNQAAVQRREEQSER